MAERDPRVDPRPGDVLSLRGYEWQIERLGGESRRFPGKPGQVVLSTPGGLWRMLSYSEFLYWAAIATVVKKSEDSNV